MKILMAGNWKMNMTPAQAVTLADGIRAGVDQLKLMAEILVCPPFVALSAVNMRLAGSAIKLGAQNFYPEAKGAFTGEISAEMLKAVGCTHVLIGHSERRHVMGETDDLISRKVQFALKNDMKPIVCVGEKESEREHGAVFDVVENQIRASLNNVGQEDSTKLIIAYEPVWAIGTGKNATPTQAQEVHCFLRNLLKNLFSNSGSEIQILYGGSVTPENADELLMQADINGALVGGASLKVESFSKLVAAAQRAAEKKS